MNDSETRYIYLLAFLVAVGMSSSVILLLVGQPLTTVTAVNAPIIGVALLVVVDKLRSIEKKVNGQLTETRARAYSAGYAHGVQGLTPRHPLTVTDHEAVTEARNG